MRLGDLSKTLSAISIAQDSWTIDCKRFTPDVTTFEPGTPHTGAYPLDDRASLQFSDRSDDYYDGPPQRSTGIDLF